MGFSSVLLVKPPSEAKRLVCKSAKGTKKSHQGLWKVMFDLKRWPFDDKFTNACHHLVDWLIGKEGIHTLK